MRTLFCSIAALSACASDPPALELSTTFVDFGPVEIGATPAVRQLELFNPGEDPLTIGAVSFASSSPTLDLLAEPPPTLAGGERVRVRLGFAPSALGVVTATLALGAQQVRVRGTGATLEYGLEHPGEECPGVPGSISFGVLDGLAPATRDVTVRATGTGPVAFVTRAEPARDGLGLDAEEFGLAAGEARVLKLRYEPSRPGPMESALAVRASSALHPSLRVPLCGESHFPKLCVSPAELDLGRGPPGQPLTGRVELSNCGDRPLELSAVQISVAADHPSSPGFTVTSSAPATLAPGVAIYAQVTVQPPAPGPSRGHLLVASNSAGAPELYVPLVANDVEPCKVAVSPSRVRLRALVHPEEEIAVKNVGVGDCVLRSATLVPAGGELSITRTPALPVTIPPQAAVAIGVAYAPTQAREVTGRLELAFEPSARATVELRGDPSPPEDCFLVPDRSDVDFGLIVKDVPRTGRVIVRNAGRRACSIRDVRLSPGFDPRFSLQRPVVPLTVEAGASAVFAVDFLSHDNTRARAVLAIESDDREHEVLLVSLSASRIRCDDACQCEPGETLTIWRYNPRGSGSSLVPADGASPYFRSCDEDRCPPGEVAVEVARDTFACADPPPSCGRQEASYDERQGAWSCETCDFIVSYGALYDSLRLCAEDPNLSCMPGMVPTFEVGLRDWVCQPTCDNGAYDQARDATGRLLCVPC